jgi:hypothetical protein
LAPQLVKPPARRTEQLLALELHGTRASRALRQQAHECDAGLALATTGLTDDAEAAAAVEVEGHPVDGMHGAATAVEAHREVPDA